MQMTRESHVNEIKIVFVLPNAKGLFKEENFPWGKTVSEGWGGGGGFRCF